MNVSDHSSIRSTSSLSTTASSSTTATPISPHQHNSKQIRKSVSFDSVHVHEHAIVLGDNPAVSSGLPIALGDFYGTDVMGVDEYEAYERRSSGSTSTGGGAPAARILSKHDRARLLRRGDSNHSLLTVLKTKRELSRIKRSREEAAKSYREDLRYF